MVPPFHCCEQVNMDGESEVAIDLAGCDAITIPTSGIFDREQIEATIALGDVGFFKLQELSFDLATRAGKYETAMWTIVAHIAESGLWRSEAEEWEEWLQGWLNEVCNRAGGQRPYSLREAQQRLSNYRRLSKWAGAPAEFSLSGSSDVMARLTRSLGEWDNKGNLKKLRPEAKEGLDEAFPDMGLKDQVVSLVEAVAAQPVHKKAIGMIEDVLQATFKEMVVVFEVIESAETGVHIMAKVTKWDTETGACSEEAFYRDGEHWPDQVVDALRAAVQPRHAKVG